MKAYDFTNDGWFKIQSCLSKNVNICNEKDIIVLMYHRQVVNNTNVQIVSETD